MKSFILTVLILLFSVLPETTSAQGILGGVCSGVDCSACDIAVIANNFISWLIGAVMVLFSVLMVIAGFGLVTSQGNPDALNRAKSKFTNAIIGLIIVLSAWILVDTLMRGIVGNNGQIQGYGPWSEIQCMQQIEAHTESDTVDISYLESIPGWEAVPATSAGGSGGFVATCGASGIDSAGNLTYDCGSRATECAGTVTMSVDGSTMTCTVPPVTVNPSGTGSGPNCPAASPSEVIQIPGTNYRARPEIVQNFVAMREAAAADGITLEVTSGWRPEETQVRLYNQYCPGGTCGATLAARPCSMGGGGSNHNSGTAVDIRVGCRNGQSGCNTATYRWLQQNGARWGFRNNLSTDPLHWSPSGR